MNFDFYLGIPLMIVLTIVRVSILSRFPILGTFPQILLLFTLAWTLLRGYESGLIWAFIAGFFLDLFSATPIGLSALVFSGAISVAAVINRYLPGSRVLLPLALTILVTILYFFGSLTVLQIIGRGPGWGAISVLPATVIVNSLFMLPIYWLMFAAVSAMGPRQVESVL